MTYKTLVRTGQLLEKFIQDASAFKARDILPALMAYLRQPRPKKVCLLCGLWCTGKSTLMKQAILAMDTENRKKSAFITLIPLEDILDLRKDLIKLRDQGYRYVFIDGVTGLEDFIECGPMFTNLFVDSGMHVVLSGKDSLSFFYAEDELWERCLKLYTTWIPFKEYSRLKNISDFDSYLRYGGILSDIDEEWPFATNLSPEEYVETAIGENIEYSIENYKNGTRFGALYNFYYAEELKLVIQRVIERENYSLLINIIDKAFKSNTADSDKNAALQSEKIENTLAALNIPNLIRQIIRDVKIKHRFTVSINKQHRRELNFYFQFIDLVKECPQKGIANPETRMLWQMPALRYAYIEPVIKILMKDAKIKALDKETLNALKTTLRNAIFGKMLQEIVLLETLNSAPKTWEVFAFSGDEFDMLVLDKEQNICHVFAIKYDAVPDQNLLNEKNIELLKGVCGQDCQIKPYIIYRGQDKVMQNGLTYLNLEQTLAGLELLRQGKKVDPFTIP